MDATDGLVPHIHPVDRQAALVWWALWETSPPMTVRVAALRMFYGARYWPKVKRAIASHPANGATEDDVLRIAEAATRTTRVDRDQLVAITMAGLMLAVSSGDQALADLPNDLALPESALLETPTMVLQRRAQNTPEGWFGRFRGDTRQWRITVEPDPASTYVVTHGEMLAPCRGGDHDQCLVGVLAGGDPQPVIRRACETRVLRRMSIVELFSAT